MKIKLAVTKITADTFKRISRELQCNRKSRSAQQRRTEAGELRTQIKFLLIGIEDQIKLCDTPFCTKTSYEELNTEIRSKLKKIVALNKLSQRQSMSACCQRASCGPGNAVGPNWKVKFSKFTNDLPQVRCD